MQTAIAVALLTTVLAFAVARPWGLSEVWVAAPAALLAVLARTISPDAAWNAIVDLGPTVSFLAAVLVLGHLADAHGVFRYAGDLMAKLSRGRPQRLLSLVFVVAAVVTAALSLDATVVLLTPIVFATAAQVSVPARPHVYACTHLANSASLLLPVSNLTNLLAFSATGLTVVGFASLMALPWLVVIAVEYAIFRWFFGADLGAPPQVVDEVDVHAPVFAMVVLGATLVGFACSELFHVHPAWVAATGALVLAVPLVWRKPRRLGPILLESNPAFCVFVLALGVVVLAVRSRGLDPLIKQLAPDQSSLTGLLLAAALAAGLANIVNNLPATLLLVPAVSHSQGLVLAVLIGVNVGPNLTYVGSLATLLWRQVLHARDAPPDIGDFLKLGSLTVPACLFAGVGALWLSLQVLDFH